MPELISNAMPCLIACLHESVDRMQSVFNRDKKKQNGFNILQVESCSDYRTMRGYISNPVSRLWRQIRFVHDVQRETTQIRQRSSVTSLRRNQMQQQTESSFCVFRKNNSKNWRICDQNSVIYFFCDTKTHSWHFHDFHCIFLFFSYFFSLW